MTGARASWWVVLVAALALAATACADGDTAADDEGPAAPTTTAGTTTATAPTATSPTGATTVTPPPAPLPGLPADVAGYAAWPKLTAAPIPPDSEQTRRVGVDAHSSTKDVHVDLPGGRSRAPGPPYPDGTVVVKAGRRGGEVVLIAIMRKIAGSDPTHGDWEFVEYLREDGASPFATSASLSGATCWGCHVVARESDWVFTPPDPR